MCDVALGAACSVAVGMLDAWRITMHGVSLCADGAVASCNPGLCAVEHFVRLTTNDVESLYARRDLVHGPPRSFPVTVTFTAEALGDDGVSVDGTFVFVVCALADDDQELARKGMCVHAARHVCTAADAVGESSHRCCWSAYGVALFVCIVHGAGTTSCSGTLGHFIGAATPPCRMAVAAAAATMTTRCALR